LLYIFIYIYLITNKFVKSLTFFFFKILLSFSFFEELILCKVLVVNLIAGTIIIHPIGFYTFIVFFFFKFFNYNSYIYLTYLRVRGITLVYALAITLSLGGVWSTQSNTWGYLWVDDLIEWLLLSAIIYTIIHIHFHLSTTIIVNFFVNNLLLINFLIFIRLGFLSTRHNFLSINLFFYINIYLYLFILYLTFNVISIRFLFKLRLSVTYFFFFFNSFFSKYIHIMFIVISFFKKLASNLKLATFHMILYSLSLFWIFSFFFFSISHVNIFYLDLFIQKNFTNLYFGDQIYNNYLHYFQPLSFITFLLNYYKYTIFSYFSTQIFLVFNNYSLIYLTLFLLVKQFEFRFLYKKKTYI
jgi:hypothetical protein